MSRDTVGLLCFVGIMAGLIFSVCVLADWDVKRRTQAEQEHISSMKEKGYKKVYSEVNNSLIWVDKDGKP